MLTLRAALALAGLLAIACLVAAAPPAAASKVCAYVEPGDIPVGGAVGELYRDTRDYAMGVCHTATDSAEDVADCVREELVGEGC